MDYKTRLIGLLNRIAIKDPGGPAVATELATVAGLVAREHAEDEMELEHAHDAMRDYMEAALKHGHDPLTR